MAFAEGERIPVKPLTPRPTSRNSSRKVHFDSLDSPQASGALSPKEKPAARPVPAGASLLPADHDHPNNLHYCTATTAALGQNYTGGIQYPYNSSSVSPQGLSAYPYYGSQSYPYGLFQGSCPHLGIHSTSYSHPGSVVMDGYQNAAPQPNGISFQPPVPDTTFGPIMHTYVPRHDGGLVVVPPGAGPQVSTPVGMVPQPVMMVPQPVMGPAGYLTQPMMMPQPTMAGMAAMPSQQVLMAGAAPGMMPTFGGGGYGNPANTQPFYYR